jgi:hypothetical protein
MTLTINSAKELLEIIQNENVAHALASRITCEYLSVIDLTTTKENLIKEVKKIADNTDTQKQFLLLQDFDNMA